ncbi:hypothetical protein As57867_001911, partial [Aphanomyces stellatus]
MRKSGARRQSEYRRQVKAERATLLRDLSALEHAIAQLLPHGSSAVAHDGKLSWQVISDVFRAASKRSKEILHDVAREKHTVDIMVYEMVRFMRAFQPRPSCALQSSDIILGNDTFVTLFANGEARNTAKQWLTQQLYYNTDRVFASFPTSQKEYINHTLRCYESQVQGTEAYQSIYKAPLKAVLAAQRSKLHWKRPMLAEMDVELSGNTTLYRKLNRQAPYWNLLEGMFYEANRCVAVYRRIQDDETYTSAGCVEHHALQWLDMRQVEPNQTLVR